MVATPPTHRPKLRVPQITWDKLPDAYILPDDPVDNIYQPLLAEGLRDGLETMGLASAQSLLPTNYGICATVDGTIVVKAPDWAYVPTISVSREQVERSYTPHLQGDPPVVVMEFLSETDGGEYSSKQMYPYGKWFFYEQILAVPNYIIFDIDGGLLEFYQLQEGRYVLDLPNPEGRHWIEEMGLFLGTWQGERAERTGYWLRWWTAQGELVPWATERANQAESKAKEAELKAKEAELKAKEAELKAKEAEQLATQERERSETLAAKLRELGVDPTAL
jgi:Uma2 family endonuclease